MDTANLITAARTIPAEDWRFLKPILTWSAKCISQRGWSEISAGHL